MSAQEGYRSGVIVGHCKSLPGARLKDQLDHLDPHFATVQQPVAALKGEVVP